jgi:YegS/Rv2252/BmrU family lipid kinase
MRGLSFIVNPVSGNRRRRRDQNFIERRVRACPNAEWLPTQQPGDARALARARRMRPDRVVVAVGGDGTVHDVARGLIGGRALLGVLPLGSGNDFARMLEHPRRAAEMLDWLCAAEPRLFDVGRIRLTETQGSTTEHHFINSLGIGFEAEVAQRASRVRWLRGVARYLVAAVLELPGYRAPLMALSFNDQQLEQRQFLVALGNGRWAGGGFQLSPKARIDDGLLELTRADDLPLWRLLTILPRVFSGSHLDCRGIHADRVERIRIDCPEGCRVHGDGEILARRATSIDITVLPGALRVLG